ncbi:hypothetical protein PoB_004871500 [Plakobranchus ocellatus]|uniref:Uncharacterized protein n=1 Tax=Plakobranchus ocellatus TaxID=259542 RepID=A0AAV4BNS8_9GAST|nr:hypothetical protein PoB_004871500 [Plakobranchus ocellatus]
MSSRRKSEKQVLEMERRRLSKVKKMKESQTKVSKTLDVDPNLVLTKTSVSVEEYFAQGMTEYFRELAEAAKHQQRKQPSVARTPSWGDLGDELARQLQHLELITRSTQTDWRWLEMAVRWRHARIMKASLPLHSRPKTPIELDIKPATCLLSKDSSPELSVIVKTNGSGVAIVSDSIGLLRPRDALRWTI